MNLLNSVLGEFEGKPLLRREGQLSKEDILSFFEKGDEVFSNPEFKIRLSVGHQQGQNTQDIVNGMQMAIFEDMGVQGDYGIKCLATVRKQFANDGPMLKKFYEFVAGEEKVLDEAELSAPEFKEKYEALDKMRETIEAEMASMRGMNEEERAAHIQAVYSKMLNTPHEGAHSHGCPTCATHISQQPQATGSMLTEEGQLKFFSGQAEAADHTVAEVTDTAPNTDTGMSR